ncbi:MAG: saccharopine dehydrogenase, partial [Pseudomonadales bacterium]|nr:saccharopine dehydrogenase [Pseudomonadales bacterium]
MTKTSKFDILLYGATGFTGKLTAAYLDQHPELAGRRWAIAGRNAASLEAVRATLKSEHVEVVVCALTDAAAVDAMVASTRVVITTAGPFSTHDGEKLLGACARAGVHYSDLSGEGFWQREMIDQYHATAVASGAKIVLGGGVDSIPSDLGAYLALRGVGSDENSDKPVRLTGVYTEYSGSFSGGTLASGKARELALSSGRITSEALNDPYILAPGTQCTDAEESTLDGMPRGFRGQLDRTYGMLLPFFMGKINAPVVRRSLALRGLADVVTYRECCSPGMWGRMAWLSGSRGLGYPLGEPINFKPKPGQGPPKWLLKQGAFTVYVTAEREDGRSATAVVAGKGDPGYGATSKMLSEVALCLSLDHERKPADAGVLTPATALGDAL